MAENESIDCPCSNISIMQLFHELKQRYPTVPDQLVSKIIQENYHDKGACETILQREGNAYLQSYPGAIISGNPRENLDRSSLCNHCPASRPLQQNSDVTKHPPQCAMPNNRTRLLETSVKQRNAFSSFEDGGIYLETVSNKPHPKRGSREREGFEPVSVDRTPEEQKMVKGLPEDGEAAVKPRFDCDKKACDNDNFSGIFPKEQDLSESVSENSIDKTSNETKDSDGDTTDRNSRTCGSECDSDVQKGSHCCNSSSVTMGGCCREVETVRWKVEDGERKTEGSKGVVAGSASSNPITVHNYQVALQYSMQPALLVRQGDQQRSFTSVNLSLRPPSSEPQPPIEIQSGQNLTYTTSVFDAKKGVQSQLQIMISPGGGGTVSACRTYISSPQMRFSCRSPYCTPQISTGCHCQNKHHLKALLEKQRERKDLLARELRKEKEKLRCMQNDVRLMKASISRKPSPHLLPKLKSDIERLRTECERLTAAVDLYSDTQNSLPLGETDEEFYRNIYTGQRIQREGSWSCQLCTFRNHPLLSVCEECEMPRISLGTQVMDVASHLSNVLSNNNTSFCTGGGTSTSASLITAPLQER